MNFFFKIYEWATQAYFIYSGEPEIRKKSMVSFGMGPPAQTIGGVTTSLQTPFYSSQHNNLNMTSHHLDDYGGSATGGQNPAENSMYGADMSMYNARGGFQHAPAPMAPKVR